MQGTCGVRAFGLETTTKGSAFSCLNFFLSTVGRRAPVYSAHQGPGGAPGRAAARGSAGAQAGMYLGGQTFPQSGVCFPCLVTVISQEMKS